MKPLQLLLVCLRENWRESLTDSLYSAGYVFKVKVVANKKEALKACNQARYDALVTSCSLPDGSPNDLVLVLGHTMPCLILRDGCSPDTSTSATHFPTQLPQIPPPPRQPKAWIKMLEDTIRQWERVMATHIDKDYRNQHMLYNRAAGLCAHELHHRSENSIKNVLSIVLEVLGASRVYIREAFPESYHTSQLVQEAAAWGQIPALGPYRSVYEVLVSESNGAKRFLGVEDTLTPRTWNQRETELVNTVATLLRATHEEKFRPASGWFDGNPGSSPLFMVS